MVVLPFQWDEVHEQSSVVQVSLELLEPVPREVRLDAELSVLEGDFPGSKELVEQFFSAERDEGVASSFLRKLGKSYDSCELGF